MNEVESHYEDIACDLRHEDIELIEFQPIARRDYQGFPMAYIERLSAGRDTLRQLLRAVRVGGPDAGAVSSAR